MMKNFVIVLCLSLLASFSLNAQLTSPYSINGKVLDDAGAPVVGASVTVEGGSQGALSNMEGRFVLPLMDSCATIAIQAPGFFSLTGQAVCHGKKELTFQLTPNLEIDEMIAVDYEMKEEAGEALSRPSRKRVWGRSDRAGAMMSESMPIAPVGYYDGGIQHNTEEYNLIQENKFLAVKNEPLSTFSIDVDAASYSNLRRFVNNGSLPPRDAVRIEEMINYFNYDYPQPTDDLPFSVTTELSECPWNKDHQLLHIGLQGKKIPTDNLPASNLVFLIDVSGSMNAPNKLPLLKSSFKLLTDQLRPQDKVAMVVYAGSSGVVLESTPGNRKQEILEAFQKLEAGGSTAGEAGIRLAYKIAQENFVKNGNNRVILATDGDFNVGQSSESDLVQLIEKERESGVFLTVLGFGMGNYKDNKMQQLANRGNGNHAYIDNIEEARKVLVTEFGGTMFTIAKDVKLQLEFNPAYVAGYRLIGYENRMLANEDFNDDKKDAGELGSGHTVTALYEIIPAGTKSDFLALVDDLKYQEGKTVVNGKKNNELMTVKLRYKLPDGDTSTKLEHIQHAKVTSKNEASDNFLWSAAVAEFGMLLRDSEFKSNADFENVLTLAKKAKGEDEEGYRMEFIKMVRSVRDLKEPTTVEKD